MKKTVSMMISLLIMLSLVGCGSNKTTKEGTNEKTEVKVAEKEKPPILNEDILLETTLRVPDSIGNVYMDAVITNNSKYALKGYTAEVLLKDRNEKVYLSSHDTILPGEKSPKFHTFGPKTSKDDIEILTYKYNVVKEDGTIVYLDYDCKLKQYTWN